MMQLFQFTEFFIQFNKNLKVLNNLLQQFLKIIGEKQRENSTINHSEMDSDEYMSRKNSKQRGSSIKFTHCSQSGRRSDAPTNVESRASLSPGLQENSMMSFQAHLGEVGILLAMTVRKESGRETILVSSGSHMSEKKIKFWDICSMTCMFEIQKKGFGAVTAMSFCSKSHTFVAITSDGTLSIYDYNANNHKMILRFCQRISISVTRLECHKNMLFIGSSDQKLIIWMNLQSRRILKQFIVESDVFTFSYIPKINSIATGINGCSLIRLSDSKNIDIYYIKENRNNSPYRRHQLYLDDQINNTDYVKLPSPILIQNGIGIDGHTQSCQITIYEKSLNCVIFVFFDFVLFYNVVSMKITYILKDLPPIEHIQYSVAHDLLLIHCTESFNSDTSFLLLYTRDESIKSQDNLTQTLYFSKLSCHCVPCSRLCVIINSYIMVDQSTNKGCLIRRRISHQQKHTISLIHQKSSFWSRKFSRVGTMSRKSGTFFSTIPDNIQTSILLETVEEEHNHNISNPSQQTTLNQEKICRCSIF